MRVKIDCSEEVSADKIRALIHLMIGSAVEEIDEIRIDLERVDVGPPNSLMRCLVELRLVYGELVSVEEVQPNLYLALSRAMDRSLRTVRLRQSVA